VPAQFKFIKTCFSEPNPQPVKHALVALGLFARGGGGCRLPLMEAGGDTKEAIEADLRGLKLL
jgi:dihydrodipicolinate synthase/N-acetylneuraminate lyase